MYNTAIHINLYGYACGPILRDVKSNLFWKKLFEHCYRQSLPKKWRRGTLSWRFLWSDLYFINQCDLVTKSGEMLPDFDHLLFPLTLPNCSIGSRWLPTMNIVDDIQKSAPCTFWHKLVNKKIDRLANKHGLKQDSYLAKVYYGMP